MRALPDDIVPGSTRVLDWPERWLVLFGSGDWHPVRVRSWGTDRQGRTVAMMEWYAAGSTWTEGYVVDPERVRES